MNVAIGNVPEELRDCAQWVAWTYELTENGKQTKVPYSPKTGGRASTINPAHWATFGEAVSFARRTGLTGIGFVFAAGDPFVGVDLDHCRDAETGEMTDEASERITALDSYSEISVSGTGVHVIVKGKLPEHGRRRGSVEMYDSARYFTVTGLHLQGTPLIVNERQEALLSLHIGIHGEAEAEVGYPEAKADGTADRQAVTPSGDRDDAPGDRGNTFTDDELIEKAKAARNGALFGRLMDGDWSGYDSQSEADLALSNLLAFWTNCDTEQMDRLFRRSGLYRAKWDERHGAQSYGEITISKALSGFTGGYVGKGGPVYSGGGGTAPTLGTGPDQWPAPLDDDAFPGLAGRIVRTIEPHTESDPAALLVQFLVAFGNVIGRGPYYTVEATEHHMNLFAVLVGATSKGRKGTSLGHVKRLVSRAADGLADGHTLYPPWSDRVQEGLSSGEGLIWATRDPIITKEPLKERGRVTGYQEVETDPGVADKRLLVVESEFASVLKLATREGNTLSATIRRSWDSGELSILNKNSPAKATGAHISIIGHVTRDELLHYLNTTEAANGFANRFLWLAVRRSKSLPNGGSLNDRELDPLVNALTDAIIFARAGLHLRRDEVAGVIWDRVYDSLSEGQPGMFGAVTGRAEAQVLRLSCLYALLDCTDVIRPDHLLAALAVWQYCESSARWIFGHTLGDATADEILRALRATPEGLTRTDLSNLFGRNKNAGEITRALTLLESLGVARKEEGAENTGGRPVERWTCR